MFAFHMGLDSSNQMEGVPAEDREKRKQENFAANNYIGCGGEAHYG